MFSSASKRGECSNFPLLTDLILDDNLLTGIQGILCHADKLEFLSVQRNQITDSEKLEAAIDEWEKILGSVTRNETLQRRLCLTGNAALSSSRTMINVLN